MISPPYTPFSAEEARRILGISESDYDAAVSNDALQRSVVNEHRPSVSVSLHSLVDIVRFAVLQSTGWPNFVNKTLVDCIDSTLDVLCSIFDEAPDVFSRVGRCDLVEAVASWAADRRASTTDCWRKHKLISSLTISAWHRCYSAAQAVLLSEIRLPGNVVEFPAASMLRSHAMR